MRMRNRTVMDSTSEIEIQKWWFDVMDNGNIFYFNEIKMWFKHGLRILRIFFLFFNFVG